MLKMMKEHVDQCFIGYEIVACNRTPFYFAPQSCGGYNGAQIMFKPIAIRLEAEDPSKKAPIAIERRRFMSPRFIGRDFVPSSRHKKTLASSIAARP